MDLQEQIKEMINNYPADLKDIADKAGVHPVSIYKIRMRMEHMHIATVKSICEACGYRLVLIKGDKSMSWYSDMRAMQEAAEECRLKAMEAETEEERNRLLKKAEVYDRDAYSCYLDGIQEERE